MSAPQRVRLNGHARPRDVLQLQHTIADALARGHDEVVLDLAKLTVLSAASLSLMCGALRDLRLPRHRARVRVLEAPPLIAQTLSVCEIDGVELEPPAETRGPRGRPRPRAPISYAATHG